jgi:hypothetical protein
MPSSHGDSLPGASRDNETYSERSLQAMREKRLLVIRIINFKAYMSK